MGRGNAVRFGVPLGSPVLDTLSMTGIAIQAFFGMGMRQKVLHCFAVTHFAEVTGFLIRKKVGDKVEAGEPLFEIHANSEAKLSEARQVVLSAYGFSEEFVPPLPLFYE